MKVTAKVCDLCHHQQPSLYCSSDSAFLCSGCDSQVHAANFLVARHIRLSLCSLCKSFTGRHHSSSPPLCRSCSDDNVAFSSPSPSPSPSPSSSSSSSSCISSTDCSAKNTPKTTTSGPTDRKTMDVLVNWCTRLGVSMGSSSVIEVARHAFEVDRSVWPYRVGLAASLWFGLLRLTKEDEKKTMCTLLKRLEEISGVPAKSIVVAESKLVGMMKHRRHQDAVEEGWAEC